MIDKLVDSKIKSEGLQIRVNPAELISSLGLMLDLEHSTQLYHAWRVAIVGFHLAKKLRPFDAPSVFLAGMLADCGAIRLGRHIVHELIDTPAVLGQKANTGLFFHPIVGAESIRCFPGMRKIATMVAQHHECYNGSGYPAGLSGDQIEPGGQILRLADQLDLIMRADQPDNEMELLTHLATFAGEDYPQKMLDSLEEILTSQLSFGRILSEEKIVQEVERICLELSEIQLFNNLQELEKALENIGDMIDFRNDLFSKGHSRRVAELADKIAVKMKLDEHDRNLTRWTSYLQNMGEVSLRRNILSKSGRFDESERQLSRYHPVLSYNLITRISGFAQLGKNVRSHHENWDGSGYPEGLEMTEIPLAARIVRVADSFDAMTSKRAYQRKREWKNAIKELKKQAGRQFDPEIVEATVQILEA